LIPFRDTLDQKGPMAMTVAIIVINFGLYLAGLIPHLNFWQMLVALLGLWLFGAYVERRLGSLAFFAIYVALAASTGFLVGAVDEASGPFAASLFMPVLILGLLHLALAPKSHILAILPIPFAMTFVEVPTVAVLLGWLALEVLLFAV
jgi:membrane associated rhomboid family serine protease